MVDAYSTIFLFLESLFDGFPFFFELSLDDPNSSCLTLPKRLPGEFWSVFLSVKSGANIAVSSPSKS